MDAWKCVFGYDKVVCGFAADGGKDVRWMEQASKQAREDDGLLLLFFDL